MNTPASPEIGKSIQALGRATNYHEHGEGSPVVLIHGSGPGVSAWVNWQRTLPEVSKYARAIALDMAGFGFTELVPGEKYTLDLWLDHLRSFLDALSLQRVALVGNSFGGAIATHFATRYPDRVSRMVCMGANILTFPVGPHLELAWGYTPSRDNMANLLNAFPYNRALITEALVDSRYQASVRSRYLEAFQSMFPAPRQRSNDMLAAGEAALSSLACDVLLIHGREDNFVPVDVSVRAAKLIPKAQLALFGQCGHWVQMERFREFNALLATFLTAG